MDLESFLFLFLYLYNKNVAYTVKLVYKYKNNLFSLSNY